MRILIVTPAPPRSRSGNRVTALRWARLLRGVGHRVDVAEVFRRQRCDLLLALHARRSFLSIQRYRRLRPAAPLVLALTGTDIYGDIHTDPDAARALDLADRFILLQPHGLGELAHGHQRKAAVVYQSVVAPPGEFRPRADCFEVIVLGHLREVKDPFRTAMAAAALPPSSRVRVTHYGDALSPGMERLAQEQIAANPRYQWLGALPRGRALRMLARSRLLALTSTMEGGANAVSEAIACGTPVVSSRISGSIGLLGEDYPGYFPVGDTAALTALLHRIETDSDFLHGLEKACTQLRHLIEPARERDSLQELVTAVVADRQ